MKNKIMQTIVGTFLGFLVLVVGTQILVSGQENKINGQQSSVLVGSWQATATPRNCQTGDPVAPAFQALYSYHLGGTLTVDSAGVPPNLQTTQHGVWDTSNPFHPTFAFNTIRFNPDGTFAGRAIVRGTVNLGASGNDYTTTGTFEVFAANGNLITMGCVTTTATRFQ